MIIRLITTKDPEYAAVWALREEVLRQPVGLSLRDEDLSGEVDETIIIAVAADSSVTGCVMLRRVSAEAVKLRQMAVAAALQGQGIGRALLQKAEETARAGGYEAISLHARITAAPFYERAGYTASGEVFSEVGIPHLFMNKPLHEPMP